jgi:MFS family permease
MIIFPKKELIVRLWPFFVYKLLKGVTFITSITLFVFFMEKGIDYFRISFLLSLLFLTPVFFEVITGIVADVVGRKFSVLIGIFLEILILLGIVSTINYSILIVLFFLWGVATTFSSGADDAWAVDSIPKEKKKEFLDQFYATSSSFFSIGMIIAGLASSFLISAYGQSSVWIARIFLALFMIIILCMKEEEFKEKRGLERNISTFVKKTRQGFFYLKNNKRVKNVILGELFITFSLVWVGSAALQPYLLSTNLSPKLWGIIYSVSAAFGVVAPFLAMKLAIFLGSKRKYLVKVLLAHGLIFVLASLILSPVFAFLFVFAHNLMEDLFNPINNAFFQQKIPRTVRAIFSSLQNTFIGIGAFLGTVIGGFLVNQYNPQVSIALAALFLLPAVILYNKSN